MMLSSQQEYLSDVLDRFCAKYLVSLETDFVAALNPPPKWIDFPLSPSATDFEQHAALRRHLSRHWTAWNEGERVDAVKYYVVDWGGIGGNKPATLSEYALLSVPELRRNKPWAGVSSWSKVLSFRSWHDCAILDSRVIAALHALQIIHGSGIAVRFPKLTSRDTDISAFEEAFAASYLKTRPAPSRGLYELYCRLIREAFDRWNETHNSRWHWHALETALFFHADKLAKDAQLHPVWGQTCNTLLLQKV